MNGFGSAPGFRMHPPRRTLLPSLLFLSLGILSGCAMPKLLSMDSGAYASLASRYGFRVYESISRDSRELFFYVVSVRMPVLLFLWMSSFTSVGRLFHLGYAWWLAASGAMLLSLFGLRSGARGLLLFGCCIFPQWILYGAMWKQEMAAWLKRERESTEPAGTSVKGIRRQDIAQLLRLTALCLLGCACEAFFGTWTLDLYLSL